MAFIPVPNVVMAEMRQTLDSQQIENTLYFLNIDSWGEEEMTSLGTYLAEWWEDPFALTLSSELLLREVYLTDLRTADGPTVTVGPFTTIAGGVGSDASPNNVALCVSFRTGGRGRSARGRNYVGGIPDASTNGSTVLDTTVAALVAAYNTLRTAPDLGPWSWVQVSRFSEGAPRPAGVARIITAALAVDPVVDSMRRRLPGRGN